MMTSNENSLNAEDTITELLTNNKQLLDKQITTDTIENIVQNCSDNDKNERYLNLMYSICQCNGEAIGSNQDDICDFLLETEEFLHILIDVKVKGSDYYVIFEDLAPKSKAGKKKGKPLEIQMEKL